MMKTTDEDDKKGDEPTALMDVYDSGSALPEQNEITHRLVQEGVIEDPFSMRIRVGATSTYFMPSTVPPAFWGGRMESHFSRDEGDDWQLHGGRMESYSFRDEGDEWMLQPYDVVSNYPVIIIDEEWQPHDAPKKNEEA